MASAWVSALEPVHATRGRVRWRYALRPGASADVQALERAVLVVDGVRKVRVNAAARALVVEYDHRTTTAERVAIEILRMDAVRARRAGAANGEPSAAPLALSAATLLATRSLQPGLQAPVALGTAIPLLGEAMDDFLEKGVDRKSVV